MPRENVPLAGLTTFRLGGPARWFAEPAGLDELSEALAFAKREGLALHVLGGGSNLLVADSGVDGLVVRIAAKGEFSVLDAAVDRPSRRRVGAGIALPLLVNSVLREGLAGLEELAGIPGTVGGALTMNAGSRTSGFGDFVQRALVVDLDGEQAVLSKNELGFAYRSSAIPGRIAAWAELDFPVVRDPDALLAAMRERRQRKAAAQPVGLASAGCVFKNPEGRSAGMLIDQAGCKGWREGGAEVSAMHANFIVNRGGATARDVSALIGRVRRAVRNASGIQLELEIKTWGLGLDELDLMEGSA